MTSPGSEACPPTTLVGILEVRPDLLEDILDTAARLFGPDRLVYLTDEADFTPLRRRGAIFEYLPPRPIQVGLGPGLPWRAYLRERWPLLLDRWRPHRVIAYGTSIEAFINAAAPGPGIGVGSMLAVRNRLLSTRIGAQDQDV